MKRLDLTPDSAFRMLTMEKSPTRDAIRKAWLEGQDDDELIYWVGAAAMELGRRHKVTESTMLARLAQLSDFEDKAAARNVAS